MWGSPPPHSETYSFGEQLNNRVLSKSLPAKSSGEISTPSPIYPPFVSFSRRGQDPPPNGERGCFSRPQMPICGSIWLVGRRRGSGAGCAAACHAAVALDGCPASLRIWSQLGKWAVIKSAKGAALLGGVAAGRLPAPGFYFCPLRQPLV